MGGGDRYKNFQFMMIERVRQQKCISQLFVFISSPLWSIGNSNVLCLTPITPLNYGCRNMNFGDLIIVRQVGTLALVSACVQASEFQCDRLA